MKTGVEIKTEFFPLAWFLFMVTPIIEIDGQKNKKSWGTSFWDLTPGDHVVKIYFPYFGMSQCGANQMTITVVEGQTARLSYNMPPLMLSKGKMKLL